LSDQVPGGPYQQMPGQPPQGGYPQGPGGPQYPYNPPPPKKKRHWVRNIFLGIVGLIVVIVVISVATSGGSGVSTTPSGTGGTPQAKGSPSATQAAAPARIGAYFDVKDDSGDTYRVRLDKVIDPAQGADQFTTPNHGMRFVGVVFTIKAISGSPKDEDADNDAAVIGSNGQTYTSDVSSIAGYTDFSNGQINVAQGDSTKGAVTFQLPNGIAVSKVQWSASSGFGSTSQWTLR
jgi:hypothetical protein